MPMLASLRLSLVVLAGLAAAACVVVDGEAERVRALTEASRGPDPVAPYGLALPAPGAELSQDAAAAIAIARNPALRAELAEAGLARAGWAAAVLPPNPVAELTWFNPSGAGASLHADLRAPVDAVLGYPWRRARARAAYDAAQARAVLAALDFAAATRLAWVEAVAAEERARLYVRSLQAAEAAFLVAGEIDRAGGAPGLDLARRRLFVLSARTASEDAAWAAEQARAALALRTGGEYALPARLPDITPLDDLDTDALTRAALDASLPLAAARADLDAALRAAGAENIDSLLGGAELGAAFDREGGETETGVSAHFDIPLFGLGHPRRAAARIRARQAADRHAALEAEIRAAIALNLSEMQRASGRAAFARDELIPASTGALGATMAQYNAMQLGVFELIDAFDSQVASGRAWVDAMERAHRARIALAAMLQGATPAGIMAPPAPAAAPGPQEGH